MRALNQNEINGGKEQESALEEALEIVEVGLAKNDINEFKTALFLLEEQLPFHPEFMPKVQEGHVSLTRESIDLLLDEGKKAVESDDVAEVKKVLEEMRSRIYLTLLQTLDEGRVDQAKKTATDDPELNALNFANQPEDSTLEPLQNVPEVQEKPGALEVKLRAIMPAILEEADLFNPDSKTGNAPSRALLKMLQAANFSDQDVAKLKIFLQKPNTYLPPEAEEYSAKSANELANLLAATQREIAEKVDEISQLTDSFKSISGNMRSTPEEREKLQKAKNELLKEKRTLEVKKTNVDAALQYKKGTVRYKSIEQVMCMTQLFISNERGEDLPAETDIYKEIERRIVLERGEKEQGMGLLGSSLEATLLILADKNPYLKQVGAAKLKELSKCWDDKVKVDLWLKGLTLSETEKKTVLGALVAYLNMAKSENLVTNIKFLSEGHLSKLIDHLKGIQHDYAKQRMEKVPAEASDAEKLKAYSDEMASMMLKEQDIHKEHLKRTGWEHTKKAGKIAGAGAAIGLGALWATMKFGSKGIKKGVQGFNSLKGENKARVITTGLLGSGAAYAGLALTPLAAVALPGLLAPEIWKHRKAIAKGTGVVMGETAKFSGRSLTYAAKLSLFPLTGGLSMFSRKWWNSLGKWKVFKGSKSAKAANDGQYNQQQNAA